MIRSHEIIRMGTNVEINGTPIVLTDKSQENVLTQIIDGADREGRDDAIFVINLGDVVRKCKNWFSELPRVKPYYAVKCNNNSTILAVMGKLGLGFDCATKDEIQNVLTQDIEPTRIIYANPVKQMSHLKYSKRNGIKRMTFDNTDELLKIKEHYPEAECVLRLMPPDDSNSVFPLSMKYGCHPDHALHLLKFARRLDLNVMGISFHVGTGTTDTDAHAKAIAEAKMVFELAKNNGFNFTMLDIGGGFPGNSASDGIFKEMCRSIRVSLDKHFPEGCSVELISEPGTYFVESSFIFATSVIGRRVVKAERFDEDYNVPIGDGTLHRDDGVFMYYLNDGVYGSFHDTLLNVVFEPHPFKLNHESVAEYTSSLWGPTCDAIDCLNKNIKLPELNVGDWLLYKNMGAYTTDLRTKFNSVSEPEYHYMIEPEEWEYVETQDANYKRTLV